MDDITHEAVDEVLQRALERIKHAGQLLSDRPEASRELSVAQRLIEAAIFAARADNGISTMKWMRRIDRRRMPIYYPCRR